MENTSSHCVFVQKIHVKSYVAGPAAGSFATKSLVDTIWSLGMRTMSAVLAVYKDRREERWEGEMRSNDYACEGMTIYLGN